eukprot:2604683-Rhodomonas_salina.2
MFGAWSRERDKVAYLPTGCTRVSDAASSSLLGSACGLPPSRPLQPATPSLLPPPPLPQSHSPAAHLTLPTELSQFCDSGSLATAS